MTARRPLARLGAAGTAGLGLLALAVGDYSATGSYTAPSGQEQIEVELTLEDDLVTSVTVTPTATDRQAAEFQRQFADGIAALVEGKDIDALDVSRVAGSSLTSGGFRAAIDAIKAEAREP